MDDNKNALARRTLLFQVAAGLVAASLPGGKRPSTNSSRPGTRPDLFRIRALDRKYDYDLHRPKGCTLLAIEVARWPGNEFGLWLPETIFLSEKDVWGNWMDNWHQEFEQDAGGRWTTQRVCDQFTVTSTLTPDPAKACLWCRHTFRNTGNTTLHELNTETCLQLANAPQFISLLGSRIWADLDGHWMTTDKVERDQSPDPRRVAFLKQGLRAERTVVPHMGFLYAVMPEAACHPLLIAENFEGNGSVGIASRDFRKLFNNNDTVLRCLHSDPMAIKQLEPYETAHQDLVIIFYQGGHRAMLDYYTTHIAPNWPPS